MAVQSIERAFVVLRALATGPLGVTELAELVDLPKSTVARLLNALENEGAVSQEAEGGLYRLGEALSDLGSAVRPGRNLVAVARPILVALSTRLRETAGLSVRDGDDVYYLDHAEVESEVQVRDWTGEYAPMHTVPSGMVLLAHLPDDELDRYLGAELRATTAQTVTDRSELQRRLSDVGTRGYAWGYEEFVDGINSVAAPVFDEHGDVVAALHVHAPAYRFPDPDEAHDIALAVIEAATALSEQLG